MPSLRLRTRSRLASQALGGHWRSFFRGAILATLAFPASAQWVVKTKSVIERSKDGFIDLSVDLPVLVGDANPSARKAINHALGVATEVDNLQKDAREAIKRHGEAMKKKKGSKGDEDEEDYPDEHQLGYEVGLNDGRIFSLCLNGYWHGGGGAVGNPYAKGCTFNAEDGQPLALKDLLSPSWEAPLHRMMKKGLEDQADELFPGWASNIEKVDFEFWLSKEGLEIRFPKYSIGPGVMGVISIRIPYGELRPIIPKGGALQPYLK